MVGLEERLFDYVWSSAVLSRRQHEVDIALQMIIRVVATARDQRLDEDLRELKVEGIFAGAKELVVVDSALSPVLRLIVQNVAALIQWSVFRAPEDAVGMDADSSATH